MLSKLYFKTKNEKTRYYSIYKNRFNLLLQIFFYSGLKEIKFQEIDDWFTTKLFRMRFNDYVHVQMEFYGCPEGDNHL